jgi:hypothetical protein
MSMEGYGGMILTGENGRTQRRNCPSVTLSITNPTQTNPGRNLGLRGERPAPNRLSHGTALKTITMMLMKGNLQFLQKHSFHRNIITHLTDSSWSLLLDEVGLPSR